MSTRCQIGIYKDKETPTEKFEVLLYKHCDGYPEGTLPKITEFLDWWHKERGIDDSEYTGARLLQYLCNKADESSREFQKEIGNNNSFGLTGETGYGICNGFHGDIEFFYKIYPNAIEIYKTPHDAKPPDFKLIETIRL